MPSQTSAKRTNARPMASRFPATGNTPLMSSTDSVQRDFATRTVDRLVSSGYQALWAGGCVRDQLLGLVPKDYDIATSATPDQVREVFGRRRTIPIGESFGVIMLRGDAGTDPIEVATFRKDAAYSDGRRPDSVEFSSAEEDAQRRDFTINGLFFDPRTHQTIDYVGGMDDLHRRVVRAIGDPSDRFDEDKLRMLRAVRFAAHLDFELDANTLQAIVNRPEEIRSVSAERITSELSRMLTDPNRSVAVELLNQSRLLAELIPEFTAKLKAIESDAGPTIRVMREIQGESLPVALAALVCPPDATESATPEMLAKVESFGRRCRLANQQRRTMVWLLECLPAILRADRLPWPRVQRILTHEDCTLLLDLANAVATENSSYQPSVRFCVQQRQRPAEQWNPTPLLDGKALIRRGVPAGKIFQLILDAVRDAQLNQEIGNLDEAWQMVDRILAQHSADGSR